MKLVLLSDTHGQHKHWNNKVPDGDVLIHAGDISSVGTEYQVVLFLEWFSKLPHKHKIFIAGNHDWLFERDSEVVRAILKNYPTLTYLQESSVVIDGIKIWGSPWTPWFYNWAFNIPPYKENQWDTIPLDTNVLITHGPPYGILDKTDRGQHAGCRNLFRKIGELNECKLHVFGHIHEGAGELQLAEKTYINASMVDEIYMPLETIRTFEV